MTNTDDLNSIIQAIKQDNEEFFEQRKSTHQNWAMHKVNYEYCLSVAIKYGSERVCQKLLTISRCNTEELKDSAIIGEAIRQYYQAARNEKAIHQETKAMTLVENQKRLATEKTKKQRRILQILIEAHANPYINADEADENIFAYICQLEDLPSAQSLQLLDVILGTPFQIPLKNVLYLLQHIQNKEFVREALVMHYGSLNLASTNSTLLNTAILEENFAMAQFLIEHGANVNFCGLAQMSPLKLLLEIEEKLNKFPVQNKDKLQQLTSLKELLITKNAKAFINPFFKLKRMKLILNLKDISTPNPNWIKLSIKALKKLANETEEKKCIEYLASNENSGEKIDFHCSKEFIATCKDFLSFFLEQEQTYSINKKFFKKIERIIAVTENNNNNDERISISKETITPALKPYLAEDDEYSSFSEFAEGLLKKVDLEKEKHEDAKTIRKPGCFVMFSPMLSYDDDQLLKNLKANPKATALQTKLQLESLSKNLKLSPKFQTTLENLTDYLANPQHYKIPELN